MHILLSTIKDVWLALAALFWFGIWVFSTCIFLNTFILRWWPGDRLLFVRLINYAMPWLLIIMIPAVIAAGMTNRKWLMLALLLPTIYYATVYAPYFVTKNQYLENNKFTLKVMSYNVWSRNSDLNAITSTIKQENPDILLLQELRPPDAKIITSLLKDLIHTDADQFIYDPKTLLGTFSRFPLRQVPLSLRLPAQKAIVNTPSGNVTVYNVHFLRTVLRRYSQWQRMHNQVSALLTEEIAKAPGCVILGGDFNFTDQNETYRNVRRFLKDAFVEAGRGFGFTFPSPTRKIKQLFTLRPIIRIDYLFYNDHLIAHSSKTLSLSGGSDHMPVVTEFSFKLISE